MRCFIVKPFRFRAAPDRFVALLVVLVFGAVEVLEELVRGSLHMIAVNLERRLHVLQLRWRFVPQETGLAAWTEQTQIQTLESGTRAELYAFALTRSELQLNLNTVN